MPGPTSRVTLRQVAESLGVSVSTVSRALNPTSRHSVAPKLAAKIQRASKKLGYTPNVAAYSLKTNRSRAIGVILPDITDPIFPPLIRGIEQYLAAHNYIAIISNTDGDAKAEAKAIEAIGGRGVDGFIIASVTRRDRAVARLAAEKPVVTVLRQVERLRVPSVTHDQSDGVRRVLAHIIALGHRDIANIAGPQDISTGYERLRSFERHAAEMDIRRDPALVVTATRFAESEGERCVEELLARGVHFTALVCANDRLAVGAIAALERSGLACPGDVSVTGMNDMPMVDRLKPPLTTVRTQNFQAGSSAAEIIVRQLDVPDAAPPESVVLPVMLVVRDSTAAPKARPRLGSRRVRRSAAE